MIGGLIDRAQSACRLGLITLFAGWRCAASAVDLLQRALLGIGAQGRILRIGAAQVGRALAVHVAVDRAAAEALPIESAGVGRRARRGYAGIDRILAEAGAEAIVERAPLAAAGERDGDSACGAGNDDAHLKWPLPFTLFRGR